MNLVGEKPLRDAPVAFGAAASADWAVIGDEFRLGAAAFAILAAPPVLPGGSTMSARRPESRSSASARGECAIEAGWLAAAAAARDVTQGESRLRVSDEAKF